MFMPDEEDSGDCSDDEFDLVGVDLDVKRKSVSGKVFMKF